MDLGISGKRAVVCASSKGLGLGCARALAAEGVALVMNARTADVLDQSAQAIRHDFGVKVVTVVGDIAAPAVRDAVLAAGKGADILINNAGGPPPGTWTDWDRDDFIAAIDANMLTPIAMMQDLIPQMASRGWGRVINITSMAVKAPIPVLGLSNTARAGLTGFVAGTSRQVAPDGVTINNLLPGLHDTDRGTSMDHVTVKNEGITMEEARTRRTASIPARRYGTIEEFGATCAFLCSAHAGYIIGQNILADGGAVNATI